eukprot:jgi/Mesvir1/13689/Mv02123-RA.1
MPRRGRKQRGPRGNAGKTSETTGDDEVEVSPLADDRPGVKEERNVTESTEAGPITERDLTESGHIEDIRLEIPSGSDTGHEEATVNTEGVGDLSESAGRNQDAAGGRHDDGGFYDGVRTDPTSAELADDSLEVGGGQGITEAGSENNEAGADSLQQNFRSEGQDSDAKTLGGDGAPWEDLDEDAAARGDADKDDEFVDADEFAEVDEDPQGPSHGFTDGEVIPDGGGNSTANEGNMADEGEGTGHYGGKPEEDAHDEDDGNVEGGPDEEELIAKYTSADIEEEEEGEDRAAEANGGHSDGEDPSGEGDQGAGDHQEVDDVMARYSSADVHGEEEPDNEAEDSQDRDKDEGHVEGKGDGSGDEGELTSKYASADPSNLDELVSPGRSEEHEPSAKRRVSFSTPASSAKGAARGTSASLTKPKASAASALPKYKPFQARPAPNTAPKTATVVPPRLTKTTIHLEAPAKTPLTKATPPPTDAATKTPASIPPSQRARSYSVNSKSTPPIFTKLGGNGFGSAPRFMDPSFITPGPGAYDIAKYTELMVRYKGIIGNFLSKDERFRKIVIEHGMDPEATMKVFQEMTLQHIAQTKKGAKEKEQQAALQAELTQAKHTVETLHQQEAALVVQLESARGELEEKSNALIEHQMEVAKLRTMYEMVRDECIEVKASLAANEKVTETERESALAATKECATLNTCLQEVIEQNTRLLGDVGKCKGEVASLEAMLSQFEASAKAEKEAHAQQLAQLQAASAKAAEVTVATEAKVAFLEGELSAKEAAMTWHAREAAAKQEQLRAEVEELKLHVAGKQALIEEQEKTSASLREALEATRGDAGSKGELIAHLRAQVAATEAALTTSRSESDTLTGQREQLQRQVAETKASLAATAEALSALTSQHASLAAEREQLATQLAAVRAHEAALERQVAASGEDGARLAGELAEAQVRMQEAVRAHAAEVAKLSGAVEGARGDAALLREQLEESRAEAEQLKGALVASRAEAGALAAACAERQQEITRLKDEAARLAEERSQTRSALEGKVEVVELLTAEVREREGQVAALEGALQEARAEMATVRAALQEEETKVHRRDGMIVELEEMLGHRVEEVEALSLARLALEEDKGRLTEELAHATQAAAATREAAQEMAATLEARVEELSTGLATAEASLAHREHEVEELEGERAALQGQLEATRAGAYSARAESQERIASLVSQLAELRVSLDGTEDALEAARGQAAALQGERDRLVKELGKERSEADSARAEAEGRVGALRMQVSELEAAVARANESLAVATEEGGARAARVAALTQDLEAKGAEAVSLRGKLREAEALLAAREEALASRGRALEDAGTEAGRLQAQVKELVKGIAAAEVEKDRLAATVAAQLAAIQEQEAALRESEAALRERDTRIREREGMVAERDETIRERDRAILGGIREKEAAVEASEAEAARLREVITALEAKVRSLEARCAALEGDLKREMAAAATSAEEAAQARAQLEARLAALEVRLGEAKIELASRGGLITRLEGELADARASAARTTADAEAAAARAAEEIEDLSVAVSARDAKVGALKSALEEKRSEVELLIKENRAKDEELLRVERLANERGAELSSATARLADRDGDLGSLNALKKKQAAFIISLEQEIQELAKDKDAALARIEVLHAEVRGEREAAARLRADAKGVARASAALEAAIMHVRAKQGGGFSVGASRTRGASVSTGSGTPEQAAGKSGKESPRSPKSAAAGTTLLEEQVEEVVRILKKQKETADAKEAAAEAAERELAAERARVAEFGAATEAAERAQQKMLRELGKLEADARARADKAALASAQTLVDAAHEVRDAALARVDNIKDAVRANLLVLETELLRLSEENKTLHRQVTELEGSLQVAMEMHAQLVDHTNLKQKIHHHMKIKNNLEQVRKDKVALEIEKTLLEQAIRYLARSPHLQGEFLVPVSTFSALQATGALGPAGATSALHASLDKSSLSASLPSDPREARPGGVHRRPSNAGASFAEYLAHGGGLGTASSAAMLEGSGREQHPIGTPHEKLSPKVEEIEAKIVAKIRSVCQRKRKLLGQVLDGDVQADIEAILDKANDGKAASPASAGGGSNMGSPGEPIMSQSLPTRIHRSSVTRHGHIPLPPSQLSSDRPPLDSSLTRLLPKPVYDDGPSSLNSSLEKSKK